MQATTGKAVAIGINHVALEVGDIDAALNFYGAIMAFELRGRKEGMAFIDLGDQFIALSEGRNQSADTKRHFGLVVDDREAVRRAVQEQDVEILSSPFPKGLDFRDPWGNHIQVVEYRDIQFSKSAAVLQGMGLSGLEKTPDTINELRDKGMAFS